ncbi:Inactive dipeptidyl peptidase 10 [Collichthys lucidus]|uniref:Inactive dipeptidyl peptidase 10 n=1 Tax=Collichthys lucidus TaxID=240159 RepID=A0A4U5U3U6_COLLU|nr:Inactive dipeptidyl peptidase 10 [Collichthys lucidus]
MWYLLDGIRWNPFMVVLTNSKSKSFCPCTVRDIGPIGQDKNWKGIGISLLVIVLVLSLIGLSIVLLSKDEEIIFRSWDGDILKVSIDSNETDLLLKNTTFATFKASKFAVSPDLNFVLLGYDVKQVYQHSFLASYLIYNLYTREVRELNPPEVSDSVLQFASWGVHGQQLLYIFENNIYYQADVQSSSWRLTSSGQEGIIFNGITDWLYEEEVLHTQVSHWWSPDGSRLAYLTINNTLVPNMLLPCFTGSLYPRGKEYPYPKMGQINPTARLYVVTVDGGSLTTELRPPDSFEKSEYYVTMVKWVTQEMLSNEEPVFSKDCSTFFITMPLKQGGHGTFNHITMISNQSEGQEVNVRHLTSGSWEVSQILAYDERTNSVDSAPGGQAVSDRFSLGWDSVLVSSDSIIVARMDGRGSGFQGQRILHEVHQRLGTVDVQDQITALEHLIRLPYIDGNKIGVYGKAYGGFLSSLLLLSYSSMFRCGIAVAPITNWRLFGSAYAEKYFGSPAKADQKYQISSLLSNITAPSPLNFLIIHGTADATVHFQHSAELVKLLSGFNVNYTLQIFPDEGHNIASAKTKHYMLNTVLTFFKQCFVEEQVVVQGTSKEDD